MGFKRWSRVVIIFLLVVFTSCKGNYTQEKGQIIRVKYLFHKKYSKPSQEEMKQTFRNAEKLLKERLGVKVHILIGGGNYVDRMRNKLEGITFWRKLPRFAEDSHCDENLVSPTAKQLRENWKTTDGIGQALLFYSVRNFQKFFGEKSPKTYEEALEVVIRRYLILLKQLKKRSVWKDIASTRSLGFHSAECWSRYWTATGAIDYPFGRFVPQFSIFVTNVPILDDQSGSAHVKFGSGILHGLGWLVSTYPVFHAKEVYGSSSELSILDREQALGWVFAHEIAHSYGLYDVTSGSKKQCLMYVGPEQKTPYQRYRALRNAPPCEEEVAHVKRVVALKGQGSLRSFLEGES